MGDMDALVSICNEWNNNHYTTRQLWVNSNYHLLAEMRDKYGWSVIVKSINDMTNMDITNKSISDCMVRAKKKVGHKPLANKKNSSQKIITHKEKIATDISVFDNYPYIWKNTKEKLATHGYTPNDFKRIGIEGITDGSTIDRKVDQAISSEEKEQGSQFASQFFTK